MARNTSIGVSWKTACWPTGASSSATSSIWANSGGVQESSWRKTVELFGLDEDAPRQVALFPEEHAPTSVGVEEFPIVRSASFHRG